MTKYKPIINCWLPRWPRCSDDALCCFSFTDDTDADTIAVTDTEANLNQIDLIVADSDDADDMVPHGFESDTDALATMAQVNEVKRFRQGKER